MSVSLQPDDKRAGPPDGVAEPRWQFSLRTLFLWMALACVLFAVLSRVGPLWSAVIVWFLILAAVHVLGNVWGSHVRRISAEDRQGDTASLGSPRPVTFAPTTRLCEKTGLGWIMPAVTTITALIGGAVGGTALVWLHWNDMSLAGVLVGTLSAAVLGGFFGFLTSSFVEVSALAWREAAREQRTGKGGTELK